MTTHASIIMLIRPDNNARGSKPSDWVDAVSVSLEPGGSWRMQAACSCTVTQSGWLRCRTHQSSDSLFVHSQLPFRIA